MKLAPFKNGYLQIRLDSERFVAKHPVLSVGVADFVLTF